MAQQRAEYVAVNVIEHNGVRAYSPGDPVDARVVAPAGWIDPEDVKPSGVIALDRPAKNASQGAWADYAVQQVKDLDAEQAAGMSRGDLIAAVDDDGPGGDHGD